jgi:hypothetical protein
MDLFEPPLPKGYSRDPVCRMAVNPATAEHKAEHAGKTYYFCCAGAEIHSWPIPRDLSLPKRERLLIAISMPIIMRRATAKPAAREPRTPSAT